MKKTIDGKKFTADDKKYSSKVAPTEIAKNERKKGWYARVMKVDGFWRVFSTNPKW